MKRRLLNIFIVIASSVILVVLAFSANGLDEMLNFIKNINYSWIVAGFFCIFLYWCTDALVIQTVMAALYERRTFTNLLKVTLIGQFFNSITPFATGGPPAQVFAMQKMGISGGHAASALIIKSVSYQMTVFIYTLMSYIFKGNLFVQKINNFSALFFAGSLANLMMILFYGLFIYKRSAAEKLISLCLKIVSRIKIVSSPDKIKRKLDIELERFSDGAAVLRNKFDMLIRVFTLQLVQLTFLYAVPYFIKLAVEPGYINIGDMIAAQSFVTMISSFVPLPGSIGGAEGISYVFFGVFFSKNILFHVILIWRLITYYSNIVIGGVVSVTASGKLVKPAH
ncbi:MAG TPA: flippase-like domain-containing protein [Clostridiaceae bacterium]|nr:flippase-like domain-containing protein [Clostridiaceae bacterium]